MKSLKVESNPRPADTLKGHDGSDRYAEVDCAAHRWGPLHLLERLGAALELIDPNAVERSRQLTEWNERLDAQDSAIDGIKRYLESHYSDLPTAKRDQLWEHLVYLANNKDPMRYVTLSASNLPIGSGVTESAAKTVVGRRAKNSGQRWSEPGLRGALTLRAIQQSDRLPRFWAHLSRRYVANVAAAA